MATAVSGRWPRAASEGSLGQANPQALIGQSPLPLLAPNPHSAFRIPHFISLSQLEHTPKTVRRIAISRSDHVTVRSQQQADSIGVPGSAS
jgi:hypothetical protein